MEIINNIITNEECLYLETSINNHYQTIKRQYPNQNLGDGLVQNSFSAYALPETEDLLIYLTQKISDTVGKTLFPTYSYCRVYLNGAEMRPHTDRPACEISLSLCVGGDPWALNFESGPITLNPGSGVLYPGLELVHWRERFLGTQCTQIFLHWVDANGPYADWKFDKRPKIGAKESEKTYWGKI